MRWGASLAACLVILAGSFAAWADEPLGEIPVAEFERLLVEIKPQPGESPWREVPWLTNITEARQRALAEDKPLVLFTAADGSPLGRT